MLLEKAIPNHPQRKKIYEKFFNLLLLSNALKYFFQAQIQSNYTILTTDSETGYETKKNYF